MADPSAADLAATVRSYLGYDSHGDWQHFAIPALDALVARCKQLERDAYHRDVLNGRLVLRAATAKRERDEAREQVASATIACNVAVEQSERDARRVAELEAALSDLIEVSARYMDTGRGDLDGKIDVARAALEGGSRVD